MNVDAELQLNAKQAIPNSTLDLLEMTVLVTAIASLLYFIFFQLAPWIWSQNLPYKPEDVTIWVLQWMDERDGIELYALYVMMFFDLLLVYIVIYGWLTIPSRLSRYFLVLPFLLACAFIGSVGFHPPMNTIAEHPVSYILARSLMVMAVILCITAVLYHLQRHASRWLLVVSAVLLIPACFISTAPIEWYDYSFILAPSLRLFHGADISTVYFQYDLFLSLIGLAWMKLKLDMNSFQVVAQCAYFLLFFGAFVFSRRWLLDKRLPVLLLIALVLVRIYAGPGDAVHSFQLTPFRHDMWLILLVLVYFKGPYHWGAGLFCGLMLLLHNNFGIIYSAAYVQLLLTLGVLNTSILPGGLIRTVSAGLTKFAKTNFRNLVFMLLCALAHYLLFRNPDVPNDYNYVRMGIAFMKIAATSFYWYVVVVSGLSFALLLQLRSRIPGNYLAAGFCLVYLAIGNSLYFFGRSHENAIIVLSPVFILLFFLLLDLAGQYLVDDPVKQPSAFVQRNLAIIVSLVFIAAISVWYVDNITYKAAIQARNAAKGRFIYPSEVPERYVRNTIATVRSVTGNNPKVYFVGDYDFLFDYYGGYAPVGYYNPVYAWISKTEFNKFLQGLVDQGYYLVVDNGIVGVLSPIHFSNTKNIGGRWVAWK